MVSDINPCLQRFVILFNDFNNVDSLEIMEELKFEWIFNKTSSTKREQILSILQHDDCDKIQHKCRYHSNYIYFQSSSITILGQPIVIIFLLKSCYLWCYDNSLFSSTVPY